MNYTTVLPLHQHKQIEHENRDSNRPEFRNYNFHFTSKEMRTLPIIDSRDPRYDQKPEVLSGSVLIPKDENMDEEIEVAFEYTDGYWVTITEVLRELNEDQKESFRFQVREKFSGKDVQF